MWGSRQLAAFKGCVLWVCIAFRWSLNSSFSFVSDNFSFRNSFYHFINFVFETHWHNFITKKEAYARAWPRYERMDQAELDPELW
jgi:hypothetical protein